MNSSIPSWLSTNTFVPGPQNFRKALLRKSSVTGQSSKPLALAVLEFPTQGKPEPKLPFQRLAPEPWLDANLSTEEAHTPPSSWYTSSDVWEFEKQTVFARNWVAVGHTGKLQKSGDFITGTFAGTSYVVVKGEDGNLRAFYNVCRHRAAPLSTEESGCCGDRLTCIYHGWQYDLEGRFRAATHMKGIRKFDAKKDASLVRIRLDTWGHWIFLQLDPSADLPPVGEYFGRGGRAMAAAEMESEGRVHVRQMSYNINCNWKVYIDNYDDGCSHCQHLHPGLSSAIDTKDYYSEVYERVSLQITALQSQNSIAAADKKYESVIRTRVGGDGRKPVYAFIYPNFMINRYSLWTGTMLVNPTGRDTCTVYMDYWVDPSKLGDEQFIEDVVMGEHSVQIEDVDVCNRVQQGIASPAFDAGRYAPEAEGPVFHFHQLINKDFTASTSCVDPA